MGEQPCGGKIKSWDRRFQTVEKCCRVKLSWKAFKDCSNEPVIATTLTILTVDPNMGTKPSSSYKWYVSWDVEGGKCVQDCEKSNEGGSCGGFVPGNWVTLHQTPEKCCRVHMSYVSPSECKYIG